MSVIEMAIADGIARISLNRPEKLNAVTSEMRILLARAFDAAVADPDVRVIVLKGNGRSFCAGTDVNEMKDNSITFEKRHFEISRLLDAIRSSPKPTIAHIQGHCTGTGMLLVTPCDIRIAGEGAKIGMTEINLGLPVLMGAGMLSAVYGETVMRRVILYSDFISGAEALRLNLATEVVPDAELDARVDAVAKQLAARVPEAIRMTKQSFNELSEKWFRPAMETAARLRRRLEPVWDK